MKTSASYEDTKRTACSHSVDFLALTVRSNWRSHVHIKIGLLDKKYLRRAVIRNSKARPASVPAEIRIKIIMTNSKCGNRMVIKRRLHKYG